MKIQTYLATLLISLTVLCGTLSAGAGHDHSHDHGHDDVKKQAGPNGGRLIAGAEPHAEFFLTKDRFVQITFVDKAGHLVAPKKQVVTLIGGDRSSPVKLNFEAIEGVLRSTKALPDQPRMPIILSIKASPDAKAVREKFYLNESQCGSCDYKEYACICGH